MELEPFGTSLRGLRFFAAVALGFKLILTGLAAREPGGKRRAILVAALAASIAGPALPQARRPAAHGPAFPLAGSPRAQWPETEADKANAWLKAWSDL